MTNKTLGLLLLPLVPLSAIGIVSLVDRALPVAPAVVECAAPPAVVRHREPPPPPAPPAPLAVIQT